MTEFTFLPMMILAITGNALWYWIKAILKENNYEISYFYGHFRDLVNFNELIQKETDLEAKSKYKKIFYGLISILVLFISCAIFMFSTLP